MSSVPLLGHASLDDVLAWRPSGPVRVREFLADVEALAAPMLKNGYGQYLVRMLTERVF